MWYLVLGLFQLGQKVLFKFALDIIGKYLKIFEIILQKSLKIWLCSKNGILIMVFVFSPLEANNSIKKWNTKQNTFYFNGSWYFKIVLKLLKKIIAVHI